MAFAGDLTFNPVTDTLTGTDGKPFKFSDPVGKDLPARGYDPGENTFQAPPADRASVQVAVDPKSDRLQLLQPFKAWDGAVFMLSGPVVLTIRMATSRASSIFPVILRPTT